MSSKKMLFFLNLLLLVQFVAANNPEGVLKKLYAAGSQFQVKMPRIKITDESEKVAAFYPTRNTIVLDQKAYEVCRSMGKDSLNALAFILGHELAHSFQVELKTTKTNTNFLTFDKHFVPAVRSEKAADIQGVFLAYLADYELSDVVPRLIPKLYEAYGLTNQELRGYPSLAERSRSAEEVMEIAGQLIDLFETANYLLVTRKNDLAAKAYAYILTYYQGREIYQNLGLLYTFLAMEYYLPETDKFLFPFETDSETQLEKLEKARGPRTLTIEERMMRNHLLAKADDYFKKAIWLDKKYLLAQINRVGLLNLMENPKEALALVSREKLGYKTKKDKQLKESLNLMMGISYAVLKENGLAETYFSKTENSGFAPFQEIARFNRSVMAGKESFLFLAKNSPAQFPENVAKIASLLKLPRLNQIPEVDLDADAGIKMRRSKDGSVELISFSDQNGNLLSMVRQKNATKIKVDLSAFSPQMNQKIFKNLLLSGKGYFLKSSNGEVVIRVNTKGEVEEIARIFYHR